MNVEIHLLTKNFKLLEEVKTYFSENDVGFSVHDNYNSDAEAISLKIVALEDVSQLLALPSAKTNHGMKILFFNQLSPQQLPSIFARDEYFRIFGPNATSTTVFDGLADAREICKEVSGRSDLLREINTKNRELETLNSELQKIVAERTYHLEMSHADQQEKLDKMRGIVKFIQDVSATLSIEDVLAVIKKDLKKFHGIRDPILLLTDELGTQEFFWLEKTNFMAKKCKAFLHPEPTAAFLDNNESLPLANFLGRPVGKMFSIPLFSKPEMEGSSGFSGQFFLILESGRSDFDLRSVVDSLDEKTQALSISLHKLLLEDDMALFTYRWEKTFDGIGDAIAILSPHYQTLRSNKHFGGSKSGKPCFEIFAKGSKPCEGCPLPKSMESGQVETGQIQIKDKIYEVRTYPMDFGRQRRIGSFVNHYRDVTERRDLYGQVLQNEKMSAVGRLAGHIAHELNNPLTGIRSLAQAIRHEMSNPTQLQDLAEIEKAAARCQGIIKNLLEFTSGKTGSVVDVNLDEIVHKTLPFLKMALRHHSLSLELATSEFRVQAEPTLLSQVIYNLVNNACQAMETNGRVHLQTQLVGEFVEFSCSDTGPGIAPEIKARLFKPFFTTKKDGQGTGLGLNMSKSIIERFGGNIQVVSEAGHGAKFSFRLPLSGRSVEVFDH